MAIQTGDVLKAARKAGHPILSLDCFFANAHRNDEKCGREYAEGGSFFQVQFVLSKILQKLPITRTGFAGVASFAHAIYGLAAGATEALPDIKFIRLFIKPVGGSHVIGLVIPISTP